MLISENFLSMAHELADISGAISKNYFRKRMNMSLKNVKCLVTEADLKIEKKLREYINITYPDHGILGEEYGITNENSNYLWVIDPIDGTTSFICGKPTFCTLIALLYKNEPLLGVVDQPINKERWIGELGKISKFNDIECPNNLQDVGLIRLNCTTPLMFSKKQRKIFESVQAIVDISCYGGDGYAYGLMASGHIDIIMENDLKFYDVAALIPIIEGIGGNITDWNGKKLSKKNFDGTILATRTPEIHSKIISMIS